jgi:hypothetical protein
MVVSGKCFCILPFVLRVPNLNEQVRGTGNFMRELESEDAEVTAMSTYQVGDPYDQSLHP